MSACDSSSRPSIPRPRSAGRRPSTATDLRFSANPADTRLVATLVLYPHDLDLGELPLLLGNVGVSVHAVDFARLHERGGLKTLGAPPATAIVVLPPEHAALAWLADDPEVVAIMHPP